MILLIDNYDSFTYNLMHLIAGLDEDVTVVRNDQISAAEALASGATSIVISPGPCTPNEAGICLELVEKAAAAKMPLFGVCLGMQSMAQAFGADIVRADRLMHGKTSGVRHSGDPLFAGMPETFSAARYHSLVADPKTVGDQVIPIAHAVDDNEIMALKIKDHPIYGVQFHPESIASEYGAVIIKNFLRLSNPIGKAA